MPRRWPAPGLHEQAAMMAFACGARAPRLRGLQARLRTSNDVALLLELIDSSGDPRVIPIPLLVAYAAQLSYVHLQERALQMLRPSGATTGIRRCCWHARRC